MYIPVWVHELVAHLNHYVHERVEQPMYLGYSRMGTQGFRVPYHSSCRKRMDGTDGSTPHTAWPSRVTSVELEKPANRTMGGSTNVLQKTGTFKHQSSVAPRDTRPTTHNHPFYCVHSVA